MKVGIVGFSQSGKSTLFQALTSVTPDPAKVMSGQLAKTKVSDARLDWLVRLFKPKKTAPAEVDFIDTPGLIRGEQADNPKRINTLRTADGLLIVLGGYTGGSPADELTSFREELMFADLEVVTNRIQKLEAGSKKPRSADIREAEAREVEDLKKMAERLENNQTLHDLELGEAARASIRAFQLFSLKPEVVVLNCGEDKLKTTDAKFAELAPKAIVTAVTLERDLAELEGEERAQFMAELGVGELARDAIIRAAYDAVGLISFFTVGEDECKAWTIRKGANAVEAAGKIHSDIARGFIRAEVNSYADLVELGTMKAVKDAGRFRLEGKEYVVLDGDIINFRFSV